MSHPLIFQTSRAPQFIRDSWPMVRDEAAKVVNEFRTEVNEIHIAGCGDSYYAGLGLELAFNLWTNSVTRAGTALNVGRYRMPELLAPGREALVIGISASGEVARTIEAIELAKDAGAKTLGLTSDSRSTLAEKADLFLSLSIPEDSQGPGLLSYLGSLLMGYAICAALAPEAEGSYLSKVINSVPSNLEGWISMEEPRGNKLAENINGRDNLVFLGAGPIYSSAMFSAAKVVEACGVSSWGQDLEEWAHIEYFLEPASMPTWLLSAKGRSYVRETEIENAAKGIGRRFIVSRWGGWDGLSRTTREAISPLFLWAGPSFYSAKLAEILDEKPFRGFSGGRSREGGGGVSRIRSSERIKSLDSLA